MSEEGYQSFVNIAAKDGSDDYMELPVENNQTVLLSTVQAQFPSAIGLKYKSSSGGWRGIRAENNVLDPPYGGWGEAVYIITESDVLKRKCTEHSNGHERKSKKSSKLLEDLIVLGIPFATTEEELNTFFTDRCGELAFCELKVNRENKKSRGFGFIRFKTSEAAEEALRGYHEIDGRKMEIRLSKKKDEVPMKLFVGRLASGTTKEDVNDYFTEFGDLTDVFVPVNPFRGFGFITYSDQEDAMKVLRMNHKILDARLHVTAAQPKEDRGAGRMENFGVAQPKEDRGPGRMENYGVVDYGNRNSDNSNRNPLFNQNAGYDSRKFKQEQQPAIGQQDVASQLKDMLMTLINSQK